MTMVSGKVFVNTRSTSVGKLYAVEHDRLRRIVTRLTGSATVAEDLVQQLFINLLRGNVPLDQAYITRAVRNLTLNHIRDSKRRNEASLDQTGLAEIADDAPSAEMQVLYRSELKRLLRAIAALPPRRREAFVLNKFAEMSFSEIAERMGTSRNTVISQVASAMIDLERFLR